MPDIQERARTLAGETLDRLAHRLNVIWRKWGAADYPTDNGVEFRNEIFMFADWMLYLFRQGCSGDSEAPNEWIAKHARTFLNLDDEELTQCIGISRVHMQAFWWHLHFARNPSAVDDAPGTKRKLGAFGKQLDWIYTVHGLPEDVARASHQLLVKHIRNGDGYLEASKGLLGDFLSQTSLGRSQASSSAMWDQWATAADMSARNQLAEDPVQTKMFCDRVFAAF